MSKANIKLYDKLLLLGASVCLIMTSCNSQFKNSDNKQVKDENQNISLDSNGTIDTISTIEIKTSLKFFDDDDQISDVVRTVLHDSKDNIWFGTQGGAFRLIGDTLMQVEGIRSHSGKRVTIKNIAEGKDGKIWFGHTDGISSVNGDLVTNYFESDGLISQDVWSIMTDADGNIWIGTIDGLSIFNGKEFTYLELPEGKIDTTVGVSSTKMIHDIMQDSRGRIWISTNGGIYIKDKDSLKNISEQDGLNTSFVNKVIEDKSGDFWISTSKGLFHLKDDTLTNVTEQFLNTSKGTGSLIEDSSGNIWFTCSRSVYRLKGDQLTEHKIKEGEGAPLTFQIYEDRQKRLWFVGYGGAYRIEDGTFLNITKNGPW